MRFCAEQRLRRQHDFSHVRTEGRRYDCGAFAFFYAPRAAPAPIPGARVGVVASTAAVGDAVRRNRAKRRLREVFRRHQALVPPGQDVLLVARRALSRLEYREIERKFVGACRTLFPTAPLP